MFETTEQDEKNYKINKFKQEDIFFDEARTTKGIPM